MCYSSGEEEKNKENKKTIDIVKEDLGLANFLKKTYMFTGMGLGSSIATAYILGFTQLFQEYPLETLGVGVVMSFISIFGISFCKHQISKEKIDDKIILTSSNSPYRIASYMGLTTGMGMTMTPLIAICNGINPMILPASLLLTGFTFGGSSLYAYCAKNNSLLTLKAPLMGSLTCFVGMGLISLISLFTVGPNTLSDMWFTFDLYGGIALFSAFSAYDTHYAIKQYKKGNPDHLGCSVNFYLDIINLLVRFLEIMAKYQKK